MWCLEPNNSFQMSWEDAKYLHDVSSKSINASNTLERQIMQQEVAERKGLPVINSIE